MFEARKQLDEQFELAASRIAARVDDQRTFVSGSKLTINRIHSTLGMGARMIILVLLSLLLGVGVAFPETHKKLTEGVQETSEELRRRFAVEAREVVVLNAKPYARALSNGDGATHERLTVSQKNEFRCLITRRGDDHYWASRGDRELIHRISGANHLFIDPTGGGYIKIFDQSFLGDLGDSSKPRFSYFEHMSQLMATYTYWGYAEEFNP